MTFGVLVETITTDEGKSKKIYKNLRFIDSYKMMNSSLEKLTDILPNEQLCILNSIFPGISGSDLQLLKQKSHYPYSYKSDRSRFLTQLYHSSKIGVTLSKAAQFQLMKQIWNKHQNGGRFCTVVLFKTITIGI